jgi:D-alanyl-D-alanine carboxypeptidase
VVGVVLGGRSASSRDDKMRSLVSETIQVAAAKRTAPLLAEASAPLKKSVVQRIAAAIVTPARADIAPAAREEVVSAPAPMPAARAVVAAPTPMPAAPAVVAAPLDTTPPSVRPGSEAPLAPIAVRTVAVKPGSQSQSMVFGTASLAPTSTASVSANKGPQLAFAEPVNDGSHQQPGVLGVLNMKVASATPAPVLSRPVSAAVEPPPDLLRPAAGRSGWMIQIGAFDKEDEAKTRLSTALARAKAMLGTANGFTERVAKGDKTLYRARFAGLDKEQAEAACLYLKKNDIACMTLKN